MHGLNLSLSEFSDGADDKGELGLRKDALHPIGWNWTYVSDLPYNQGRNGEPYLAKSGGHVL